MIQIKCILFLFICFMIVIYCIFSRTTVSSVGSVYDTCPSDWVSNGDNCYKAIVKTGTYNEARTACLALEATLTSVENEEEQNFLSRKKLLFILILAKFFKLYHILWVKG